MVLHFTWWMFFLDFLRREIKSKVIDKCSYLTLALVIGHFNLNLDISLTMCCVRGAFEISQQLQVCSGE